MSERVPTSFRLPKDILNKLEVLAEAKTKESGLYQKLNKTNIITMLIQKEYEELIKKGQGESYECY